VLTREEEQALGKQIQLGVQIRKKIELLVHRKEQEAQFAQESSGPQDDVLASEFLYEDPIDESLLLASGEDMVDVDDGIRELLLHGMSVNVIEDYQKGDYLNQLEIGIGMAADEGDGENKMLDKELVRLRQNQSQLKQIRRQRQSQARFEPLARVGRPSASPRKVDMDLVLEEGWLTADDLQELGMGSHQELCQILSQSSKAREELIRCNVKLVVSIAKQWFRRSLKDSEPLRILYDGSTSMPSLDEAIQEGIMGLNEAAVRFNPDLNFKFSTYSSYWITNYIRLCFQRSITGPIRVPRDLYKIKSRVRKIYRGFQKEGLPGPSREEVADRIGVSAKRLELVMRATRPLVSLDDSTRYASTHRSGHSYMGQLKIGDFVKSPEDGPEELVDASILRQCLENAMASQLSPYERDVLRLRLGLDDGVSRTVKQVMEVCGEGVTYNDVRSAELRAYSKLRSPTSVYTRHLLSHLRSSGVDVSNIR